MPELQNIRFNWTKIITDEFAVLEKFDKDQMIHMSINVAFAISHSESKIAVQPKCIFIQDDKTKMVIAATGHFLIDRSDWDAMIDKEKKTMTLAVLPAQHLASLMVGTLRGILHTKTEGQVDAAIIIPPVNITDIVKENIVFQLADQVSIDH
ncbi:MAG TPA: hypothetical protein VHC96_04815 [Puia sp.]|jgi:hypothetical protein|nr:hypothetical protein [Puia sp.]